jgi:PAS domain S-box-containing protein
MQPGLLGDFLSKLSLAAAFVFMHCAFMVFRLDPKGRANRVALVFNAVFATWAIAASFWYVADKEGALALYRAFSWAWCVFPPLILHFTMRVVGRPALEGAKGRAILAALYLPALLLSLALPSGLIDEPVFRGGYWMLAVRKNALYYAFVFHYFSLVLVSVILAFGASTRARTKRERLRLKILGWSYLSAGLLGFLTDTVFLSLGIDFPNLAIHWIVILSVGMLVSMDRYGFLTTLPARDALGVLSGMAGLSIYVDDAGTIIWANAAALRAIGASDLDELRDWPLSAYFKPDTDPADGHAAADVDSGPDDETEFRGELGPSAVPVRLKRKVLGGGLGGAIYTGVDLRPERAMASARRRLEEAAMLLDEFVGRSLDGIVLTDPRGTIVRWNQAMARLTGVDADEAIGRPYWELRSRSEPPGGLSPERIRSAVESVLRGERVRWTRRIVETEIVRADGVRRFVQSDSFPIPTEGGHILATIARDVTDEKRKIEANIVKVRNLDRAQKLEAIGTLAGGIAHDFNNTLAGIVGAMSVIRQEVEGGACSDPKELRAEFDIIERSAHRAASSVNRLLTLTRRRAPESKPFRLDEAVRRVAEFASSSMDACVHVSLDEPLPEAAALGDFGQIEQLVLNLVINGGHAMTIMRPKSAARGGELRLSLEGYAPSDAFFAAHPEASAGAYWLLRVRDQGVGIARQDTTKIFDPFYTTKGGEASSGLGLAMVLAIARQHGGVVEVESELGKGSEFRVYLPVYEASDGQAPAERPGTGASKRRGLVLLADDDPIARESAELMLKALGYATVAAADGAEAIRLFNDRPDEWFAAVLDMRMGQIGGDEAGLRMRAQRPELPLVLASGFHDESTARQFPAEARAAVIDKPYTMDELAKAIDAAAGAGV